MYPLTTRANPQRRRGLSIRVLAVALWLVPAFGITSSGCETSCGEKGGDPVLYTEGSLEEIDGRRVYSTTSFDGVWLHFPSERQFRLRHNLGTEDYTPVAYVALQPNPAESEDSGEFAHAAGNEAVFESITADELVVRNATCSEFYLLVRIEAGSAED